MPVDGEIHRAPNRATILFVHSDPQLPAVFTLEQALRTGLTAKQVERRVATQRWHRLRRGCFCRQDVWDGATPERRHVLLATAVYLCSSPPQPTFSHVTAASLWGLPVPRRLLDTVVVTADPAQGVRPRHDRYLQRQVAALPPAHLASRHRLVVTSPARTVADCLRHLDAFDAVPIADAAVRLPLCTVEEIAAVLAGQASWPYAAVGRASLALTDGRRESPLESRSAVVMHRHDIPAPRPQVVILDTGGAFVARPDFTWLEHGVVGEADGRGKYRDADGVDAFDAEKERQARLEALGLVVVRWNSRQLAGDFPVMVARLRAALARGQGARFTGRAA
jgi:hypothetical protein